MKDLESILTLLFDSEDQVSVSDCKGGYHSMPQSTVLSGEVPLVHPEHNKPIRKVKTVDLNLLGINAIKGWSRDEFVTKCRAFLWEADVGNLPSQWL